MAKYNFNADFEVRFIEVCSAASSMNQAAIALGMNYNDGNRYNNAYENLRLLCPNCHALTDTYRAKNIRKI